jgi:transcriptional regulator with XRE-family HTH domain
MDTNDWDEQEIMKRKNLYIAVGTGIREYRKAKDMTQEQLAEAINKTPNHMRYLESGTRQSPLHVYAEIANVLGCTLDDLLAASYTSHERLHSRIIGQLSKATDADLDLISQMIDLILTALHGTKK